MTDFMVLEGLPVRMESGPLQFGDDWPGVFLRGDHALHYAFTLKQYLSRHCPPPRDNYFEHQVLIGLIDTLEECNVHKYA
jgi:hypothetical protein